MLILVVETRAEFEMCATIAHFAPIGKAVKKGHIYVRLIVNSVAVYYNG